MSLQPVNSWDMALAMASETTFGTTPTPASVAAYKALFVECISANLGPAAHVGQVRAKQDRGIGRGMTDAFVEGRVAPFDWTVQLAMKSRSASDGPPLELALYKAAGLNCADAGSTYTITPTATPIASGYFAGITLQRLLGSGAALYESEKLRGGVCKNLKIEGGDKELMLTATGQAVGKYTQGALDSLTCASGVDTALTLASSEDSYRIDLGYYLIESEIILVTAYTAGSTGITVTRAQLGTTGAAHTAQPAYPYKPALTSQFSGSPISEANSTVTLAGVSGIRCISWSFELVTGMDLLPGETGSAVIQGAKSTRYEPKASLKLVLSQQQLTMIGRARSRPSVATSVTQGSGTGSAIAISMPQGEITNFNVPDSNNDVAIVDVALRLRDSAAGNDAFTITLS